MNNDPTIESGLIENANTTFDVTDSAGESPVSREKLVDRATMQAFLASLMRDTEIADYPGMLTGEQSDIFCHSFEREMFSRSDGDWEIIWRTTYHELAEWERYPNVRQELCPNSNRFVHECLCGRPVWVKAPFSQFVRPAQTFRYFLDLLNNFEQHVFCSLDPATRAALVSLTPYDYHYALYDCTDSTPLAVRWAAYKAFTLAIPRGTPQFQYMYDLVNRIEADVRASYFTMVIAQGAIEDVCNFSYDLIKTLADFCGDVGHSLASQFGLILQSLITRALSAPHDLFVNFKKWLAEAMIEGFAVKASESAQLFKEFILHPITTLLFKTMIRWWMGLNLKAIAVEILWDPDLTGYIPKILALLTSAATTATSHVKFAAQFGSSIVVDGPVKFVKDGAKKLAPAMESYDLRMFPDPNIDNYFFFPEAVDEAGVLVLLASLAIGSFDVLGSAFAGINFPLVSKLTRDIYSATSLLDKLGTRDAITNLINYVKGVQIDQEEAERFKILYPHTMNFLKTHVEYVAEEEPNNADKAHFKYMYSKFVAERLKWSPKDSVRLAHMCSLAVSAATQLGSTAHYQFRREPSTFVFMGPPGLGKTTVCEAALNAIANKENPDRNLADAIYTVCMTDSYCSGYVNQELWKFDDMFKRVDSVNNPSPDIELMFSLCTTAPFVLNMAALEDKGKVARCYLAAGSTNLSFFQLEGKECKPVSDSTKVMRLHVESYKDAGAIRRRLTHCVLPIVQAPYVYDKLAKRITLDGAPIKDTAVDRSILYRFYVLDTSDKLMVSPADSELWTWRELLNLMWQEYSLCRDYSPEDDESLVNDSALIADPEGWQEMLAGVGGIVAGGIIASAAGYVNERVTKPSESCPCGDRMFVPNEVCCMMESKARSDHKRASLPGVWDNKSCYDVLGNFHVGSFRVPHYTGVLRFVLTPTTIPTQLPALVNWKELMCTVNALAKSNKTSRMHIQIDFDRVQRLCVITPGLYELEAWYISEMPLAHSTCMTPGQWLTYTCTDNILLPLIGGLIGGGIARFLHWKFQAAEDADHVIVKDGEPLFLDPDTMEYTAQAPLASRARVFKNGKWYYKVKKTNGGYEWYAQSPDDNPFINLISKSQRLACQAPSLQQSIWAVVDESGVLKGNVFAIDSRRVLCPLHVAHLMAENLGLTLVRDKEVRKICPNFGSGNFKEVNVLINEVGPDVAIVEFFVSKLPEVFLRCRDHIGKFCSSTPKSGSSTLMRRNARGEIETSTGLFSMTNTIGISYAHANRKYDVPGTMSRLVDVMSDPGWCGALYVDNSESAEHTCLGIHVARGRADNDFAVMHVVTQSMLKSQPVSVPVGNVWLQGHSESHHLLDQAGIHTTGKSVHPPLRSVHGRDTRKQKTVFHGDLDCQYDMAKLRIGSYPDGSRFDPWAVSLKKLGDRVNEPSRGTGGLVEVVHALVADYKPHFPLKELPEWSETVSSETGLPSVSKKTSAGDPYYPWGGLKGLAFVKGCEVNIMTPEFLEYMKWLDDTLAPDDWRTRHPYDFLPVESVVNADNKDEPRAAHKVFKPRLYHVMNEHEFLLERRYFADVAVAYGQMNTVFCSALGLAPTDFDVIHSSLCEAGDDAIILALDHEHMDGHVKPRFVRLVALFLILLTNAQEVHGRFVDPMLPKVNRRGFMMWRLLQRLAWFVMKVGDALAEPGASHPSGSFLTAVINGVVQDILTCWVFFELLHIPISEVITTIKRIFLGDDSLIAIPRRYADMLDLVKLKELFASQGFVVTGSEMGAQKNTEIVLHQMWSPDSNEVSSYAFLSRYFAVVDSSAGPSVVGLLEQAKIEKIICFAEPKKLLDNFPEQVLSMIQEIEMYDRCDYPTACAFVKKMHKTLDRISPGFLTRSFGVLRSEGDVALIRMEVLKYLGREPILADAQAGEGSQMSGLTDFTSEVVSDAFVPRDEGAENWREAGMDNGRHNDPDIFATPFGCHDFDWDSSSDVLLMEKTVPSMYFDGNPNAQMKLANYAYLRATAVVKVIINSSPYVAGKLLLSCRPLGRQVADEYEASGDPCVEIDAASGKEAELRLPCIIPHNWSLVEQYGETVVAGRNYFDWGYFNITVLSTLNAEGVQQVHGRVYCWLEDVVLQGPTPTAFTISAQAPPKKFVSKTPTKSSGRSSVRSFNGRADPFSVKMAGTKVSESSSVSAGIDKYVTPVVRSIGGVLAEVGTTALTVAKLAALAGFSVPSIDNNIGYMNTQYGSSIDSAHMEGAFIGPHFATRQQQRVTLPEGVFDMTGDEMHIPHFCSRMGLCFKTTWEGDDTSDTVIKEWAVNPGLRQAGMIYSHHTPLSFVSTFFRLWRGTIKYRLAIAKTRFHTGTLEICLSMGVGTLSVNSEQRAAKCYRRVWNVNEMSSIEFEVPYCAATMWSPTLVALANDSVTNSPLTTAGKLTLRVVNPLVSAGSAVTDNVEILVYMAGGDDIEFAVPYTCYQAFALSPPALADPQVGGGVYQDDETDGVESGGSVPLFPANPTSVVGNVACVGERVDNLRLLTRRFGVGQSTKTLTSSRGVFTFRDVFLNNVLLSLLSRAFAFASGGFRIETFQATVPSSGPAMAYGSYGGYGLEGGPAVFRDVSSHASYSFSCPYYGVTPYLPVAQFAYGSTGSGLEFVHGPVMSLVIDFPTAGSVVYRSAAGDDFTYGWQIGIPPLATADGLTGYVPEFAQY